MKYTEETKRAMVFQLAGNSFDHAFTIGEMIGIDVELYERNDHESCWKLYDEIQLQVVKDQKTTPDQLQNVLCHYGIK
jgi:hypothetical protein